MSILKIFRSESTNCSLKPNLDEKTKYEELVYVYHYDLFRYAFWLCRDKSVAEDLVQETYLRAWKSLDSLCDKNLAKSWLITILRRENARRFERKQFNFVNIDYHCNDVRDNDESHHKHGYLLDLISKLDDEYREPLFLQTISGFNCKEIAKILGINKKTVFTRLFRARNYLKVMLEEDEAERRQHNTQV